MENSAPGASFGNDSAFFLTANDYPQLAGYDLQSDIGPVYATQGYTFGASLLG